MMTWKRIAGLTLIASVVAAALAGGLVIYSGAYNVSATAQHTAPVYYLLESALQRSVRIRTLNVEVPDLEDPDRIVNGFKLFRTHCVQCHGAPGVAPEPFALGLTPVPASLVDSVKTWSAAETHWIIRYGIKMSGMPAWEYRISDEETWDIVAFMAQLPTLSPADYKSWSMRHAAVQLSDASDTSDPSAGLNIRPGDARAGKKAIQQYLCATCHAIPGVVGANHHVGPSLADFASRQYIAGVLPNTPANMVRWLQSPSAVDPLTAMPDLNVSDQDARDIAAFLYTLRDE